MACAISSAVTTWMDQLEGIHHHIAGAYLLRYAQERSWRGDNGRLSNGEQVNRLAGFVFEAWRVS